MAKDCLSEFFLFSSNKTIGLTIINNLVTHELKGSLSIENTGHGVLATIHYEEGGVNARFNRR